MQSRIYKEIRKKGIVISQEISTNIIELLYILFKYNVKDVTIEIYWKSKRSDHELL